MQFTIAELCGFAKQHIAEEVLQIYGRFGDTFLQVAVVGTNQCVTEVPRVRCKKFVGDLESKRLKIFDHKDCCSTSVAFAKNVYLPKVGTEADEMFYCFIHIQAVIPEFSFLTHVVFKRLTYGVGTWLHLS